jgi:hypothetical protein
MYLISLRSPLGCVPGDPSANCEKLQTLTLSRLLYGGVLGA